MEKFKNKIIEGFMNAVDFINLAFHDLKKAYYNKESEKELAHISKFMDAAKNMVEYLYKGAKAFKYLLTTETKTAKAPKNGNDENSPYPEEMADMLAGMTPDDFRFLKQLQPEVAKIMGVE